MYITHTAIIARTKIIPKNKNVDEDFFKAIVYIFLYIYKSLIVYIFMNPAWEQQSEEVFHVRDHQQQAYPARASYHDPP